MFLHDLDTACDVVLTDAVNIKGTSPSMPVVKRTKTF